MNGPSGRQRTREESRRLRTIESQGDVPRHRTGLDDLHAVLLLLEGSGGGEGDQGEGEGSESGEHGEVVRAEEMVREEAA